MDALGSGSAPRTGGFDVPLADATAAVAAAANALRIARQRYREVYLTQLAEWRALRDELDELELRVHAGGASVDAMTPPDGVDLARRLAGEDAPVEAEPEDQAGVVTPEPWADARPVVPTERDIARLRERRVRLELVESDLGRHRSELARIELALDNLESTWLFLGRNDGSLVMDPTSPATSAALRMRIVEAQEAERSRLAQEIHDGPAQALTNAIFQVQYVERVLDQDMPLARTELRYMGELLRRELSDVRSYISQLRPPLLDQLGLEGAIRDTVDHIGALSGVAITLDLAAPADVLDERQQTVVLRVAQEALQNVRKHAAATSAGIVTKLEPGAWVLDVHDDGHGFDVGAVAARGRRNFGLQFMRERAGLIGARLEVRSGPEEGTTVRLSIPTSKDER